VSDHALGLLLIGVGILFILVIVFAVSSRGGGASGAVVPPRGVHMPSPSWLPLVLSVGAAILGAALAFKPDDLIANPWLGILGLVVLVAGIVLWVRAAGREWRDVEHGSHDDARAH
jgi:hypothetical protein